MKQDARTLVLVIEDDPEVRAALSDVLCEEGYAVVTADHGGEALELAARGIVPALILLDLSMPVMDGREFLARRAEHPALGSVPVVVVSATCGSPLPFEGVVLLQKPVDLDVLLATIARRLEH